MAKNCKKCVKSIRGIDYAKCAGYCEQVFHFSCIGLTRPNFELISSNGLWLCEECRLITDNKSLKELFAANNNTPQPDSLQQQFDELKQQISSLCETITSTSVSTNNRLHSIEKELANKSKQKNTPVIHHHDALTPSRSLLIQKSAPKRRRLDTQHVAYNPTSEGTCEAGFDVSAPSLLPVSPPEQFWLYLSGLHPLVTIEDIQKVVSDCLHTEEVFEAVKLVPKDIDTSKLTFVSFKIGLPPAYKNTALLPQTWPKGVRYRPFEFKKKLRCTDNSNNLAVSNLITTSYHQLGCSVEGITGAPCSPSIVAPIAASVISRPSSPVSGAEQGVAQPITLGKYDHAFYYSKPDSVLSSVINAPDTASSLPPSPDEVNIWCYYQNVRGLRTKIDDVFLVSQDCNFDIIIFVETGLDASINSLQLFGNAYNVFRCDRSAANSDKIRFGGVLICIAQQYRCELISTQSCAALEQVCVSCYIKGLSMLVVAVYIPPLKSSSAQIIESHIGSIYELLTEKQYDVTLICGDFNQPRIIWRRFDDGIHPTRTSHVPPASAALIDGMNFLSLNQANLCFNRLERLLDLIFCSAGADEIVVAESVAPLLPVDPHHPPLTIALPVRSQWEDIDDNAASDTRNLNYRKIDFATFASYVSGIDWTSIFIGNNVDFMASDFCHIIRQWLTANLPLTKRPASPPWCTSRLRILRRARNASQRCLRRNRNYITKRNFKIASTNYRRLNASLYRAYVLRIQTDLRSNPKNFWRFVNSKRKSVSIPANVYLDDAESSEFTASSELFAKYFASVYNDKCASEEDIAAAVSAVPADLIDLTTFEITPEMLESASKKLKSSYSPGPDGIPAVIFCRCVDALAYPLCWIFNRSMSQECFPAIWKDSHIFPVFKKGDRRNVRNYRAITSLSAASKLFEIIVANVILQKTKNYISENQHGFMPGRSITTNLLHFTSVCIKHMEARTQVDAVYTDLKAAFDKIDHGILLRKISRLGASVQFINWLDSYLTGRTLCVKLGTSFSLPFSNLSGVPQGSNIGPLLFILYFNDVALVLNNNCILIYADDLKLFLKVQSVSDCVRLQCLLNKFVEWCRLNFLIVSIDKCAVMTFHRISTPIIYDYEMDGLILNRVESVSDLGIILDSKLSFSEHQAAIITKANKQLGFIARIARELKDPYCLKALYCSLVRPILETASVVWSPYQLTWTLRIEKVQKRFIRFALRNLPWTDRYNLPPYTDRCRLLNLDSLQQRRKLQQIFLPAKLLYGIIDAPELLSSVNFRTSQRLLRASAMLQPQFHRTSYGFYEPLTSCVRAFLEYDDLFDFGESFNIFKNRIIRCNRF